MMKVEAKYGGKWIAIKNEKIISSESTLNKLMNAVKNRKDAKDLAYTLIPKGLIAG